ncbi:unnamed protein product [Sphagnum jensenii]
MDEFLLDEICVLRTTPVASVPPFRAARVPDPDWLPAAAAVSSGENLVDNPRKGKTLGQKIEEIPVGPGEQRGPRRRCALCLVVEVVGSQARSRVLNGSPDRSTVAAAALQLGCD